MPTMLYIENDGAIFRGPARGVPLELWSVPDQKFVPYAHAGRPKPIEWGNIITEAEAKELMAEDAPMPAAG